MFEKQKSIKYFPGGCYIIYCFEYSCRPRKCISRIFYSFTYYLDSIIDDILLEHAGFFLVYYHAIIVSSTYFPSPFDDNKQG